MSRDNKAERFVETCGSAFSALKILSLIVLVCVGVPRSISAQTVQTERTTPAANPNQLSDIEGRLNGVTDALTQTRKQLEQSQSEIQRLHAEIEALKAQSSITASQAEASKPATPAVITSSAPTETSSSSLQTQVQALQEQQDLLQAEVAQHDQSKVETESKYKLQLSGLVLFNAYANAGVVDDADLPTYALSRSAGSSHGSLGGNLRQTILGFAVMGPVIGGAHTSASLNADFFGGIGSNIYGYAASSGYVRLRDAQVSLDWTKTSLQFAYTRPLISPHSPTSFATVAEPSMAGSGNLWTWSPQIEVTQQVPLSAHGSLHLEGGLIDTAISNTTSIQLVSPVEASRRPGLEGRVAYVAGDGKAANDRSLILGVGAYSANQSYSGIASIHSWAVTGDWQVPVTRFIELNGQVYRGRALGGLGGGTYKDTLTGTDPVTGLPVTLGVETAGGWTQLKFLTGSRFETNVILGVDDAFARNFEQLVLPANPRPQSLPERNRSLVANFIYRPLSSLILSPEYRRITTSNYHSGSPYVANIYTLSAGYRF